jgi:hypothetical protein
LSLFVSRVAKHKHRSLSAETRVRLHGSLLVTLDRTLP